MSGLNAREESVGSCGVRRQVSKKANGFLQFILDQLKNLPGVTQRAMFAGFGLYQHERFFGIIYDGRLYFKTNDHTRLRYVQQGMKPFRPNASQTLKNYFEVPVEVIEDPDSLFAWAQEAVRLKGSPRGKQSLRGSPS